MQDRYIGTNEYEIVSRVHRGYPIGLDPHGHSGHNRHSGHECAHVLIFILS